ncbi:prolyl oligopeptidase family serine peptidase, partial [Steroidobacter sp.]|uniref:prolyl oligopeptidase family serine peptidase n=1 Tax=Steroidobacter sp. TaxID=1978227 RepID=UPI0025D4AD5E
MARINYRGSSGRGLAFARGIYADWGNKDRLDLIAGVDYLIEQGIADPDKLGVGGWSQGGILTNYVIARDSRFKAAISGAGAGSQIGLYGTDQYVIQYDHEFEAPWVNPQRWLRLSYPFFEANKLRTPTLSVSGLDDVNVPGLGSEQMFQALKSLDVPTQLVIYPGEKHMLGQPHFVRDRMERYLDWYA